MKMFSPTPVRCGSSTTRHALTGNLGIEESALLDELLGPGPREVGELLTPLKWRTRVPLAHRVVRVEAVALKVDVA